MVREEGALGLVGGDDAGVHALEGEGAGEVGAAGEEEAGGEELLEGGRHGLHGALGVLRAELDQLRAEMVQGQWCGNLLGEEAGDVRVDGAADDEERAARLEVAEAGEDLLRGFVGHLRRRHA